MRCRCNQRWETLCSHPALCFLYQTFVLETAPTYKSAIELQEDYFKAYARRATANEKLEHYETALEGSSAPWTLDFGT